jgi:hypothetical protein
MRGKDDEDRRSEMYVNESMHMNKDDVIVIDKFHMVAIEEEMSIRFPNPRNVMFVDLDVVK